MSQESYQASDGSASPKLQLHNQRLWWSAAPEGDCGLEIELLILQQLLGMLIMKRYIVEKTMDDLMQEAYTLIIDEGLSISPSKGDAKEIFGCLLELTNPRARVSRSQSRQRIISALGELLWYLSGSDDVDQIAHYVDYYKKDPSLSIDGHVTGAYGPRLFNFDGINQLQNVVDRLRTNPDSRNAVIQVFDHQDTENAPCTLALQFVIREGKLLLMVSMRSNDVYLGLPHDLFAFTMLQELVARSLGIEPGSYFHSVGSFHLYEQNESAAGSYLAEGWQDEAAMPVMPLGDPWDDIRELLRLEEEIRLCERLELTNLKLPADLYWRDLAYLLCVLKLLRESRVSDIPSVSANIESKYFREILLERIDKELWKESSVSERRQG
ncbi:thymidylate synthase [Arthrobacter sp. AL08]|uniref:thymidylate synthase n=1 Tax=unclassified Arthrobacter TaxID=235627 RepID=UPI00249A06EB|nr:MULTISPECIES: thymidylate synthase [unclassified Arthrobacter]MDI3240233.1 thymidylate synthase [Arthrobacter sp. AL05]MDI3276243.1 thymidylate synthase [Arthrobacter sp. AL08]